MFNEINLNNIHLKIEKVKNLIIQVVETENHIDTEDYKKIEYAIYESVTVIHKYRNKKTNTLSLILEVSPKAFKTHTRKEVIYLFHEMEGL